MSKKNLSVLVLIFALLFSTSSIKAKCSFNWLHNGYSCSQTYTWVNDTVYMNPGCMIEFTFSIFVGGGGMNACACADLPDTITWYRNNVLIQTCSALPASFMVTDDGFYQLFFNQCGETRSVHVLFYEPTGLNTTTLDNLSIYPNPAKNKITLRAGTKDHSKMEYCIMNSCGKIVLQNSLISDGKLEKEIDVSTLASGLYFISVMADNKQYRQKMIIAK